jgi:hypothetical protein
MKLLSQKQACQQKQYDDTLYEIRTNENNIIVSSDESMDSSSDSDDASTEASSIVSPSNLTFVEDL